ncbi:MAG: DNA lyase [bacterium]
MKPELPEPWLTIYAERKADIQARLSDFASVQPSDYFYELLYCILTPQSHAKNADQVIAKLRADKFLELGFDPVAYLRDSRHYIRFHNVKSKRLLRIREIYPQLHALLGAKDHNIFGLREKVMSIVPGLGLKESSHFLRNIGIRGLTILDRHILRHLHDIGIIGRIPKSLTPKRYFTIEKKWLRYSERVEVSMDELDLLFWSMATGEIRK